MLNQAGGTQADTIVKLVLIFFISLLSFSVGTFVGKQVSDSDYKRAALEEDYQSFRQADTTDEHGKETGEKISEEELSSLTEEFVNKEKAAAAKDAPRGVASTKDTHDKANGHAKADEHAKNETSTAEPKVTATADQSGYKKYSKGQPSEAFVARDEVKKKELAAYREKLNKSDKAEEHKTAAAHEAPAAAAPAPVSNEAQRVADGKAPVADPAKVRTPTSVLPSVATSSVGKYTVQVASYATEEEAKAHAAELKTKGWNSFYLPADIKGRTWFRVSIGLFTDQKSAMNFREELMRQSSISSAIVQKIVQ